VKQHHCRSEVWGGVWWVWEAWQQPKQQFVKKKGGDGANDDDQGASGGRRANTNGHRLIARKINRRSIG